MFLTLRRFSSSPPPPPPPSDSTITVVGLSGLEHWAFVNKELISETRNPGNFYINLQLEINQDLEMEIERLPSQLFRMSIYC